jgi:hypothetical protein
VGYEDLERIPQEVLEKSTVRILPQATTSGPRVDLDAIVISPSHPDDIENALFPPEDDTGANQNLLEYVMEKKRLIFQNF